MTDIGQELVQEVKEAMPWLPDYSLQLLTTEFGLTEKDTRTLMGFDDGGRVEYFFEVVNLVSPSVDERKIIGKMVGNW